MSVPEDQSERVPVSTPMEQPRERTGLSLGRIINGAILLIHVATFITCLCVIGLVGNLMREIGDVRPAPATQTGTCPFYVRPQVEGSDSDSESYNPLAPNGVCLWFIAGHIILAIAAIVFFVVGVVRIGRLPYGPNWGSSTRYGCNEVWILSIFCQESGLS